MQLMGKPVAEKIKNEILEAVESCKKAGEEPPKLAILRIGEKPDDLAYERRVLKNCAQLGIETEVKTLTQDVRMTDFLAAVSQYNEDPKTHGILIFRPLPPRLSAEAASRAVRPDKDIDCMNPANAEKIFAGDKSGIPPCTPEAVIEMLKYYRYDLTGKNVVIVNRSMVLGKPLAMLFLEENATVTVCHSKTVDLPVLTARADIVVTGTGKAKYFGKEFFSPDSVVIDVGINMDEGRLCGDVDFDSVQEGVAAISPVPGGVGTVTSMILLRHIVQAMKRQKDAEKETNHRSQNN